MKKSEIHAWFFLIGISVHLLRSPHGHGLSQDELCNSILHELKRTLVFAVWISQITPFNVNSWGIGIKFPCRMSETRIIRLKQGRRFGTGIAVLWFRRSWEARIPHGSAWVQALTRLLRQPPARAHLREQQEAPCHPQEPWLVFQGPGLRQVGNRPVAGGPLSLSLPLPCLPSQSKQSKFLFLFWAVHGCEWWLS